MRFFTARRLALIALFPALLSLSVVPGCSQQGEGERCADDTSGVAANDDCADGLTCTPGDGLLGGKTGGARCCYPDRQASDSRCSRSTATNSAGASNGGGSNAGSGGGDAIAGGGSDSETPEAGAGGV